MKSFEECCQNVGLPQTRRQFKKFKTGRGLAYKISIKMGVKLDGYSDQKRAKADALANKY